ncbi:MAG: hypothetical protein WDO24_23500 [Pseudomonadota bacterium]
MSALKSFVVGYDATVATLDFDVLAAFDAIQDGPRAELPLIDIGATDYELMTFLKSCHDQIERIWQFVGGCTIRNFETLALWMMGRDDIGRHQDHIAGIFSAFVYGDRALALRLTADFETHWQERARGAGPSRRPKHLGTGAKGSCVDPTDRHLGPRRFSDPFCGSRFADDSVSH